ncbi:MAG: hypothetical protein Q4F67_15195 [Propionibacteriaceae bacterium]|nr:hypothetical protein [Propionibacteriaceae bacterium]
MTLTDQLKSLLRSGDVGAAGAVLEGFGDMVARAQKNPLAPESSALLDQVSYLRGWSTLHRRLHRLVGSGPASAVRPADDLLLVSHPGDHLLRSWVGSAAAITEVMVELHRAEADFAADEASDLCDTWGLPLDRYADQAIELVTEAGSRIGAPVIVVQGQPWLAVAASAAAHRLDLPLWWDLRGDALAVERITEGRLFTAPVPFPPMEASFRAAASTARLVVTDDQVAALRGIPELRDRLLVIGRGRHGTAPTYPSVWAAWRAAKAGEFGAAPRQHFAGDIRAAFAPAAASLRVALIGNVQELPLENTVRDPAEIRSEEIDAVVIDASSPDAWAAAKGRAIQARTYHLPIVALGLPEPGERPFADIIATFGPVPREARTSGHQPQWGFVPCATGAEPRVVLRAAGLPAPASIRRRTR